MSATITPAGLLSELKSAVQSSSRYELGLLARVERVTRLAQAQKNELDMFLKKIEKKDLPSIEKARDVVEKSVSEHVTKALKYGKFKNKERELINPNIDKINQLIQKLAGMKRKANAEAATALEQFREFLSDYVKPYNQKAALDFQSDQFGSVKDLSKRTKNFQNALRQIKKELPWWDWLKVNRLLPEILWKTKPHMKTT